MWEIQCETCIAYGGLSARPHRPRHRPASTCTVRPVRPYIELTNPAWSRDAVLYQINTRQFTPEGTFARRAGATAAPQGTRRRHPLADADPPDRRGEPQGHARQPLFGAGLLRREPRVRHQGRFQGFRRRRACAGLPRHPRLGRQPHRLGQPARAPSTPTGTSKTWNGNFRPTPWWDWSDIIDLD